jgi:hypothetical protein
VPEEQRARVLEQGCPHFRIAAADRTAWTTRGPALGGTSHGIGDRG